MPLAGPSLPLWGERVVLCAVRDSDIERVAEACSQPEFERFMPLPWPYERSDAEWFVREFAPAGWRGEHAERVWAIRDAIDGPLLGVIGLRETHHDCGFWLHPDARGRGVMVDAVRTAAAHAFDCLAWPVLRWECVPGNVASARVARAAGFSYTGERPAVTERCEGERAWTGHLQPGTGVDAAAFPWPDLD